MNGAEKQGAGSKGVWTAPSLMIRPLPFHFLHLSPNPHHQVHHIPPTPPTSSPERHCKPHTHHHQSDASIFWTKTGEEIPPNLRGTEQNQPVAALTSSSPRSPCFGLTTSLQFSHPPTHTGSSPAFLSTSPGPFSLLTIQSTITCPPRLKVRTPQRWYQVPVSDWISINSSS